MITLSNGHIFEYMTASGAMGFDGQGWFWEKPLIWAGLIKPKLFTIGLRTLTRHARYYPVSNHSWGRPWTWLPFSPWSHTQLLKGGSVNKVALWNMGFDAWCKDIGPKLDPTLKLIGSIYGDEQECVYMAERLNDFPLVGLELNPFCPNSGHDAKTTETVIKIVDSVKKVTRHPLIIKLSVAVDCQTIAWNTYGMIEAVSLNSVPWELVFPYRKSPVAKIGQNTLGGGISGEPAQNYNWATVDLLAKQMVPVIAPSCMTLEDVKHALYVLGAKAVSFGAIHLPSHPVLLKPWTILTNPCKPTKIVLALEKELQEIGQN